MASNIVVPFAPQPAAALPSAALAPPDPKFMLMAAAQMHSEGRLVQAQQDLPTPMQGDPDVEEFHKRMDEAEQRMGPAPWLPQHEEWESQGRPDYNERDEPPQEDMTQDIMRRLGRQKAVNDRAQAQRDAIYQRMGLPWKDPGGTRI